jgi:hypothetical protein
LTAETAAPTAEAGCFPTADLVLRPDFVAPPAPRPARHRHLRLHHWCPRRPPPMSQIHKTTTDDLPEVCTCPT